MMDCTTYPYFHILKCVPSLSKLANWQLWKILIGSPFAGRVCLEMQAFFFLHYIWPFDQLKDSIAEVLKSQVDPTGTSYNRHLQEVPWISFHYGPMFLNLYLLFYVSSFVRIINLFSLLSLFRKHWNFCKELQRTYCRIL